MAVATGQPPQRPKRSMGPWLATAFVLGILASLWMKWLRRRETPGEERTPEPEPVSDRLPLGLGLE